MKARSRSLIAAVALFASVLPLGSGEAYRFPPVWANGAWRAVHRAADAQRWDTRVWGPGETLPWHVVDHPGWAPAFADVREALPLIERGLDAWGEIPSADIRWHVDGVVDRNEAGGRDGRNTVFLDEEIGGGYARIWSGRDGVTECDIGVEVPREEFLEPNPEEPFGLDLLSILIHELGHCLPLGHPPSSPTTRWWEFGWTRSLVGRRNPQMAYGPVPFGRPITRDDAVGASLLYPAAGWRGRTGSVSGQVSLDGSPASLVSVSLMPLDNRGIRENVNAMTDRDGAFVVEGLAPGDYLMWVHPVFPVAVISGSPDHAVHDFDDLVVPWPVRVAAGRDSGGHVVTLRRGRGP